MGGEMADARGEYCVGFTGIDTYLIESAKP